MAPQTADVKNIFEERNGWRLLSEKATGLCAIHGDKLFLIEEELQDFNDECFHFPSERVKGLAERKWREFKENIPKDEVSEETSAQSFKLVFARDCKPILGGLWTIKRVLPATGLGVVYGEPGCGKTFVVVDMMMSVAREIDWRGMKTSGGKVLYIAPDGGALISNRLCAYRKHFGCEDDDIPFAIITAPVDVLGLHDPTHIHQVKELIKRAEFNPDVVVIDTVSRSMPGGNENSPETMTSWIDKAQDISPGKLTLGVHHCGKDTSKGSRGHSSLKGAADVEIEVADRTIVVRKLRDGRDGEKFSFGLGVIDLGVDADGEVVTSCFVTACDLPVTKTIRLSANECLMRDAIESAIKEFGGMLPQDIDFPMKDGVEETYVVKEFQKRYFEVTSGDDKRKVANQAMKRAVLSLCKLGIIAYRNHWFWFV